MGLAVLTVVLSAVALPAENILLARYTPQRHRGLAFGVKFVLAFAAGLVTFALAVAGLWLAPRRVWLWTAVAGANCSTWNTIRPAAMP